MEVERNINFNEIRENENEDKSRYLSEEQKWIIIISYRHFWLSQQEINDRFLFCKSTVSKIIKKYEEQGNVTNNFQNSGRPSLQRTKNISESINEIVRDQKVTLSSMVQQNLDQNYKISASRSTICKILKDEGYQYGRINIIHKLTDEYFRKNNPIITIQKMFCLKYGIESTKILLIKQQAIPKNV